jgi:hypothetical protein
VRKACASHGSPVQPRGIGRTARYAQSDRVSVSTRVQRRERVLPPRAECPRGARTAELSRALSVAPSRSSGETVWLGDFLRDLSRERDLLS